MGVRVRLVKLNSMEDITTILLSLFIITTLFPSTSILYFTAAQLFSPSPAKSLTEKNDKENNNRPIKYLILILHSVCTIILSIAPNELEHPSIKINIKFYKVPFSLMHIFSTYLYCKGHLFGKFSSYHQFTCP